MAAFVGIQAGGAGRSQALTALNTRLGAATDTAVDYKLEPSYGPHVGNTRVSIVGNRFTGATAVNLGVTFGLNCEAVNDGLVRATTPPAPLDRTAAQKARSDVTVTIVFPTNTNRVVGTFYYYTVELPDDKKKLTIFGTGLAGATGVQFGDADAVSIKAASNQELQIDASDIPPIVWNAEVDVAFIYAPDTATKRSVIGRFRFPP